MLKKLLKYIDLKSDLDNVDEIHRTIRNGIIFKGTNLWVLVFAIIVASVGLNTNSTAVIIGAMLISPLMGPINGMGYSIATYDYILFRRALKNFGFAVSASLVASTIYFSISPLSTAHSELLARTSPTIYDVLIALFGGLAGIVAISSKHKGNVIPGVAIATALMPPLCTAGYGLATAQFTYFFGALYLFTINTVFIGISSVLFSQLLKFPIRTLVEPNQRQRVNRLITAVTLLTTIPSFYFGYILVGKETFTERANQFVASVGVVEGSYLLKHDTNPGKRIIKLTYGGDSLSETGKRALIEKAKELRLDSTEIVFEQGFSFSSVNEDITEVDHKLRIELNRLYVELKKSDKHKDSLQNSTHMGKQLLHELQALYPQILSLIYSNSIEFSIKAESTLGKPDSTNVSTVILSSGKGTIKASERKRIDAWLKARLNSKDRLIIFYDQ